MLTSMVTIAAEESVNPLVPALPDLVWGTLAFVIVLAFFWWKVLPAMNKSLDARRDAIEGGIQRAEEAQAKATAALEEYTAKLAEARGEAGAIRDNARADGAKIVAEAQGDRAGGGRARHRHRAGPDRGRAPVDARLAAQRGGHPRPRPRRRRHRRVALRGHARAVRRRPLPRRARRVREGGIREGTERNGQRDHPGTLRDDGRR